MGYYIFSYGINTAEIKEAIGSKDNDLFEDILETEIFDNYSDQNFPGHTTTREALEHLIFGHAYDARSAHAYWYAFIALCAHLGQDLPSTHEIKLGYETDLINGYMASDFGIKVVIEEVLINERNEWGLPVVQDWPLSGLLDRNQLTKLQSLFAPIEITDEKLEQLQEEDDEKEMAYDSIRQTKENIDYCIYNNLDLISFCH